jgi:hypothetical protein
MLQLPNRKLEVELTMLSSNYHIEMSPGDVGHNDRYVVQAIIKEMAKSRPLDATGQQHQVSERGRESMQQGKMYGSGVLAEERCRPS